MSGPPPRGPGPGRGPQLQQWGQAAQALNPAQQQQLLQYGSAQLAQGASLDQQQRQQLQWMVQSLVSPHTSSFESTTVQSSQVILRKRMPKYCRISWRLS